MDHVETPAPLVGRPDPVVTAIRRRRPKVSEQVARDLAAYIVDSKLQPSTRLPTEKEMAEQLGVGRATLREALRLLETRGIITIRSGPQGGPVVRRPDAIDLAQAITLAVQFDETKLEQVVEARILIESTASRLAAPRMTTDQIDELKRINRQIAASLDDNEEAFELNRQFHRDIANASGNVVLGFLISALLEIYHRALDGLDFGMEPRQKMVEHHDRVIAALEARDGLATERALHDHAREGWEVRKRIAPGIGDRKVRWEV